MSVECCHRSESLPKTLYRPPPRILGPAALILGLLSDVKISRRARYPCVGEWMKCRVDDARRGFMRYLSHLLWRVDGAGFWGIYFRIMVPMSLPIFTVAVILQVTGIWNDFLFGIVYTGPENYPMTVQLNNIVNSTQGVQEYNVNMAATIITGLVPLTIYFISGKLFVRGIAAGAVKG